MEQLVADLIPLAIPAVVLVAKKLISVLPKRHIPTIVGVLGLLSGLVTGESNENLTQMVQNMLQNGTVAMAGIGVHQVKKQVVDKKQAP